MDRAQLTHFSGSYNDLNALSRVRVHVHFSQI